MASSPEFRLLGPLEVRLDGRVAPVRAGKHRVLLAALLLRANRVVPIDELVERLWEDSPPARTRGTLQTYVMRLRQTLGDPSLIRTVPDGYQIRVPTSHVDVYAFADLAERGRLARNAGDPAAAAEAFTRALDLWRGPALADVPSDVLHREEVPRLVEQRLHVLEQRIDVDFGVGRHAALVSELRALTSEYPLRERFWSQLMLALYRSSRQAEALDAFRQVDRLLEEQLGIDPSEELRELHHAILVGDPTLAAPQPHTVTVPGDQDTEVPAQLPADIGDFVGRAHLVDRIIDLIAPSEPSTAVPIVTLSGPPGIGKTALAVHVAHLLRKVFPDGQLYVNLRGYASGPPLTTVDVLARFLRALGVPPEQIPLDADEQSTMFRSLLSGRRLLVVLDNAAAPDQVRPLLPGDPSCPVLVTSREDLRGLTAMNGARRVPLDVLDPAESVELLASILGPDTVRAERAATGELATLCAHLPLALRVAAANLAGRDDRTVTEYATELRVGDRLSALSVDGDQEAAVLAAFDLSYAALKPELQRLFRLLSLVPGPEFGVHAAANLLDCQVARAHELLTELVSASLLQEHTPGRYQFHDLLRLFAIERAAEQESEPQHAAARTRLLDFYLQAVDRCAEVLYPDMLRLPSTRRPSVRMPEIDSHADALRWLDLERPNLTATIQHTGDFGPAATAWRLADAMRGYLWLGKHVTDWLTTARVGLHAAHTEHHRPAEAAMYQNLGMLHWTLGDYPAASEHYNRCLGLYRDLGNDDAVAGILNNLGLVHVELGDLASAKQNYLRCLTMKRAANTKDDGGEANVLINLGLLSIETGDLAEATGHLTESLRISRAHGYRANEATCHNSLGIAARLLGDPAGAMAHHTQALRISEELGYHESTAQVLESMAAVHLELGRYDRAVEQAELAVAALAENGDQQITTNVLVVLGEGNLRLGDLAKADQQYQQAVTKARKVGFRLAEARALLGLAMTRRPLGKAAESVTLCRQVLAITEDAGLRVTEGLARTELAWASLALGEPQQAVAQAELALAVQRATGHVLGEARTLHVLGAALARTERLDQARQCLTEALPLLDRLTAPDAPAVRALLGTI
ncbi:tetratricopeptide repeat protein [Solihabitans fulvus]|uniref:Tetratricopeptide repeat protein n=1 Tax=Solihabitans fulvus TaxID=1892852 RepID=A0A5B2WZZ1_9PSEU|nr:BTAD domain-containing putative transcriptional regulator [Solihabitans fulvus]KAA2256554.1 tetratricopeptide repeat protein [Solihabitans fulvus]